MEIARFSETSVNDYKNAPRYTLGNSNRERQICLLLAVISQEADIRRLKSVVS
jgi:hypothetical protein